MPFLSTSRSINHEILQRWSDEFPFCRLLCHRTHLCCSSLGRNGWEELNIDLNCSLLHFLRGNVWMVERCAMAVFDKVLSRPEDESWKWITVSCFQAIDLCLYTFIAVDSYFMLSIGVFPRIDFGDPPGDPILRAPAVLITSFTRFICKHLF